jgi:hypothetical protein
MNVELLLAPDCPNASAARAVLATCLRRLGLDIRVRERVGEFASPTILVDGIDAMTGVTGVPPTQACRLDLPTQARVLAALRRRCAESASDGAA